MNDGERKGHLCPLAPHHGSTVKPPFMRGYGLFFAVYFVRNGEFLATFSATSGEYATTVSGQHTLTETMLVVSLSVVGLECSFHCDMLFLIFYCSALCRSGDSAARYSGCKFR